MKTHEKIIDRKDILVPHFQEIFKTEWHYQHEIIADKNYILRWKSDFASKSEGEIMEEIESYNGSRNSESFRKLYRDLGFSLSGYYDLFYWLANNEDVSQYVPLQIP